MRRAIIISALLLAGCDSGPQWENEQHELTNELNATAPAANESNNILADTDYLNETSPASNAVNAADPASNGTAPPPESE